MTDPNEIAQKILEEIKELEREGYKIDRIAMGDSLSITTKIHRSNNGN